MQVNLERDSDEMKVPQGKVLSDELKATIETIGWSGVSWGVDIGFWNGPRQRIWSRLVLWSYLY